MIAVVIGALVVTVLAVVAVNRDEAPGKLKPYDVAGERADARLGPLAKMKRPKGLKGVDLDAPPAPEADDAARLGVKPKKTCDPVAAKAKKQAQRQGQGLDGLFSALAGADEVCSLSATRQSMGLVDKPRFEIADGFDPAPMPQRAPKSADPDDDPSQGASQDPSDPGTEDPSTDPTADPGQGATPGSEPSDDPSQGASESSPSGSADESAGEPGAGQRSTPGSSGRVEPSSTTAGSRVEPAVAARASGRQPHTATDAALSGLAPAGEYLSPNWVQATPQHQPPALHSAAMAYDEQRNEVVLFGGRLVGGAFSAETWTWDGADWHQESPTTSPAARTRASMAWDPVNQRIVMFGGQTSSSTTSAEVWAWDGADWSLVTTTSTAPAARAGAVMAFDLVREAMIVFGGELPGSVEMNDTWQLKNTAGTWVWTEIQANGATGAPPARYDGGMAYSQSTSQLVLFGGGDGTITYGDTWTLDATATSWLERSPTHTPPARGAQAMTYDPGIGGVVMFGGLESDGTTVTIHNDTWAWRGNDWSQATGIASPTARAGMGMAATSDGQVVMFGGLTDGPTYFDETWTYDSSVPVLSLEVTGATGGTEEKPVFWVGDSATVQITAANAGVDPIEEADQVSIISALQDTLLAVGTQVKWDNGLLDACTGLVALCGGVLDLATTIANIKIPVDGTKVGEFVATVTGGQKGCELIDVPAVASSLLSGGTAGVSRSITVCGGGLGLEDWWTYDTTDLGGGGTASVNVANGNLVVKQYDTDPVQMPGRLAIGLGRVYNSQDLLRSPLGLINSGGPLGAGWQFDIGDTGITAGGFGLLGLKLPNLESVLQPLSMPYVDRDGTRHVFKLRSIAASLGGLSLPIDLTWRTRSWVC